jgi:hypothetical protein
MIAMVVKGCARYWDRYVDMSNSHTYLDEIPTWFQYYTIG